MKNHEVGKKKRKKISKSKPVVSETPPSDFRDRSWKKHGFEFRTFLVTIKNDKVVGIREFQDGAHAGLELNKIIDTIGTPLQEFDSAFIEHCRDEDSLGLSVGDHYDSHGDEMSFSGPMNMDGRDD